MFDYTDVDARYATKIATKYQLPATAGRAAQWIEQAAQIVVIEFIHQGQQLAQFAAWKALAGEPAEVMAGHIGNLAAFVFTVRHFPNQQEG